MNDSRLRIYEQLEISIADMEKVNSRLVEENTADKARIKRSDIYLNFFFFCCENICRSLSPA